MKKFILISSAFLATSFSSQARQNMIHSIVLKSKDEKKTATFQGTLVFDRELSKKEMASAKLCFSLKTPPIQKVDLWMPDMGHGSALPVMKKLAPTKNKQCYSLTKMMFMMEGSWQVRVFFDENEIGYFNLKVEK